MSWAQVVTSNNSSSVPKPPGIATNASASSAIASLRSCMPAVVISSVTPVWASSSALSFSGITPITSPPPASAASAITPISPTRPPP